MPQEPSQRVVDHANPTPLAEQLAALLRAQIESGKLASGSELPSERELTEQHNVARTTVRRAIKRLAEDGMITVLPRRGIIVR